MSTPITFSCPHCGNPFEAPPDYFLRYGGRKTACSNCNQQFTIPRPPPAPPRAAGAAGADAVGAWGEGDYVRVTPGALLPDRCPLCNAPAGGPPRDVKLVYRPPRGGGIHSASTPVFAGQPAPRKMRIQVRFCPAHLAKFRAARLWPPVVTVGCVLVGFAARRWIWEEAIATTVVVLCAIGAIVALRWLFAGTYPLRVAWMDDESALVSNCDPAFVRSLPIRPDIAAAAANLHRMASGA